MEISSSHISCKVLQSLPNIILVSFEDKNKTYQGVLLDVSSKSCKIRNILDNTEDKEGEPEVSLSNINVEKMFSTASRRNNNRVRLRARNVVCNRCRQVCAENGDNVENVATSSRRSTYWKRQAILSNNDDRINGTEDEQTENDVQKYESIRRKKLTQKLNGKSSAPVSKTSLFRKHNIFTRNRHSQHTEYVSSLSKNFSIVPMLTRLEPAEIEKYTNLNKVHTDNSTPARGLKRKDYEEALQLESGSVEVVLEDLDLVEIKKGVSLVPKLKRMEVEDVQKLDNNSMLPQDDSHEEESHNQDTSGHKEDDTQENNSDNIRTEINNESNFGLIPKLKRLNTEDVVDENPEKQIMQKSNDYSISFRTLVPNVKRLRPEETRMKNLKIVIKRLKESEILKYSICPSSSSNSSSKDIPSKRDHNESSNDVQEYFHIHSNELTETTDISKVKQSSSSSKTISKTGVATTEKLKNSENKPTSLKVIKFGKIHSGNKSTSLSNHPSKQELETLRKLSNLERKIEMLKPKRLESLRKKIQFDKDWSTSPDVSAFCEVLLKVEDDVAEEDLRKIEEDLIEFTNTPTQEETNEREIIVLKNSEDDYTYPGINRNKQKVARNITNIAAATTTNNVVRPTNYLSNHVPLNNIEPNNIQIQQNNQKTVLKSAPSRKSLLRIKPILELCPPGTNVILPRSPLPLNCINKHMQQNKPAQNSIIQIPTINQVPSLSLNPTCTNLLENKICQIESYQSITRHENPPSSRIILVPRAAATTSQLGHQQIIHSNGQIFRVIHPISSLQNICSVSNSLPHTHAPNTSIQALSKNSNPTNTVIPLEGDILSNSSWTNETKTRYSGSQTPNNSSLENSSRRKVRTPSSINRYLTVLEPCTISREIIISKAKK